MEDFSAQQDAIGLSDSNDLLLDLQQQGSHEAGTTVMPTNEIHTIIATDLISILALSRHKAYLVSLLFIQSKSRHENHFL